MTIARAFTIVIGSSLFFGAAGAGVGALLGAFVPQFYQVVLFHRAANVDDYVLVGGALGLTQGLMIGIGVGLVIIVAVCWLQGRTAQRDGIATGS